MKSWRLTKLLEPQLPVECWSLWASQWALPGLGKDTGVRDSGGVVLSVPQLPPHQPLQSHP